VSVDADLSWTAGSDATSHDVYFGTTDPPPFVQNQTQTTFDPGTMANDTTYYWRIDELNAQGTTTGVVWSFTTAPPSVWLNQDVGGPGQAGSASESAGLWTIEGGGWDIWGTADAFHYVYQSLSGDGEALARVVSVENTDSWAKAGVMIRETLTGGSKHAIMVVTPGNGTSFQRRTSTDGSSDHTTPGDGFTAPYWVRLVRSGDTLTGYRSSDGSGWSEVGSATVSMATDVYIGLAVTAHNDGTLCTAEIDNVTVQGAGPPPPGQASNPNPANGATDVSVEADISWTAGTGATSHDVYFGTDSTPDSGEFQGNQTGTTFDPGTMANDTTYYWRIDSVNAGGTTTGVVWSFTTEPVAPPGQASNPSPANGAASVSINADLSWTAGSGATSHDVYFGTDSTPDSGEFQGNQAGTTFDPGTLEYSTTYYWRIDEVGAGGTTTGVVWSFTTAPGAGTGTGLNGDYYDNIDFTAYVLTRTDATVNFDWGSGSPDPSIGADQFSVRWTGFVEPLYSETYTFYTTSDDGVRLWVDSQAVIDNWTDHGPTEDSGTIALTAGVQYDIQMDFYENGGGAVAQLEWSSPSQAREVIPQSQLYEPTAPPPPGQASNPSPANGATDQSIDVSLSWTAGSGATSHDVYFGTDSTPDSGEFMGNQPGTSYDPGTLYNSTTYYWRIDEVGPGGTTTGVVWSFTTEAATPPPGQASNPNPANSATDVSVTTDLSWTAGSDATSHDVYFGTASPGTFQGNQTGTTFDPGTLANDTTYYWRIDEKNAIGTTTGVVWSFVTGEAAGPVTLSSVDFETDFGDWSNVTGDDDDWYRNQGSTPSSSTGPDHDNTIGDATGWYAYMETSSGYANTAGDEVILESSNYDGTTYDITLSFYYHMYGSNIGTLNVDVYDGSWHNGVWSLSGQQHSSSGAAYTQAIVDLSAYSGTIQIRIRAVAAGSYRGDIAIDDIEVTGTPTGPPQPPGQASNPSPANGATGVSINADLSWTAGSGATSHDVYFGQTTSPPFVQNQAGTTYDPGTLSELTTYYWRIDEKNAAGTTTGVVWSFTTESAPPPPTLTAYYCDVDRMSSSLPMTVGGNLNSKTEATSAQYDAIASSDNSRWTTPDPGSRDEVFLWLENSVTEGSITSIDLTFEGYLSGSSATFSIWARDVANGEWDQIGTTQSIPTGSDGTMTRSITSDIGNYVSGETLIWGVYESTSSQSLNIDYVNVVVNTD